MPLVRIDAPALDTAHLRLLGDAVHGALVATLDVPEDDRFQVLNGAGTSDVVYDPGYLGVHRDDGFAAVHVFLRAGRDHAQKRAFYRAVAERCPAAGVEPRNVFVALTENTDVDWSFGNGVAQRLDVSPEDR